jgi:hypothetical protein
MIDIPTQPPLSSDASSVVVLAPAAQGSRVRDIPREVDPTAIRDRGDERTDSEKRHPFRDITLKNGDTITVPTARAADMENPLHVGVTGNPASTPGYFRLLIPAFMMRYVARALCDWSFGLDKHNPEKEGLFNLSNNFSKLIDERVKNAALPIREFVSAAENAGLQSVLTTETLKEADGYKNAITRLKGIDGFQKALTQLKNVGYENNPEGRLVDLCNQFICRESHKDEAKAIQDTFKNMRESHNTNMPFEFSERIFNYITNGENIDKPGQNWKSSIGKIESTIKSNARGMAFDASVGTISAGVTAFYAKRVSSDIYNLFSEAYAYEKYMPPEKVKFLDMFFHSDNKIIQKACDDFGRKNLMRGVTDAFFFTRCASIIPALSPKLSSIQRFPVAEAALGVKEYLIFGGFDRYCRQKTESATRPWRPHAGIGFAGFISEIQS